MNYNIPTYASCLLVDGDNILLIRKNRPAWQYGKINIVGGKVEDGESPKVAAIREVFEETGLIIDDPRMFCELTTKFPGQARVFFFVSETNIELYKQKTDEKLVKMKISSLLSNEDIIPNLKYLIFLALDKDKPFAKIME